MKNKQNPKGQLIVALDVDTLAEAKNLIEQLSPVVDIFKVGSQLFTACGPAAVRFIQAKDKQVFLDLKFHDIPNTVANAVSAAVALSTEVHQSGGSSGRAAPSILMYTVHIQGGRKMLEAAALASAKTAEKLKVTKPLVVGITVLTSEEKKVNIQNLVLERARLARDSGLDGVVASAQEAEIIRKEFGKNFVIVTPGIRPKDADAGDQQRTATPAEAIAHGSDFLVVGRPILKAKDPVFAAKEILEEMSPA